MITFTVPPDVATIRARIAEIQQELAAISAAALCDKEAEEKIQEVVEAHASRAQTGRILSHLIHAESSSRIAWPTDHAGKAIEPSGFDLLCAFDPKRMQESLKRLVLKSPHLRGPEMTERDRRSCELRAALYEAEVEEEVLIEAAEACGINVHRRADANPAVILGEPTCT